MRTEDEIKAMITIMESELINMPDEKSYNKKKQITHNNIRDHLRIQRASLQWVLQTTPPKAEASAAVTMEKDSEGSGAVTMEKTVSVKPDEQKSI